MTPDEKGSIAETAIIHAAVKLGIGVLKPINDGLRYDLMFDLHPELMRIQCKWARRVGGAVVIQTRSCRRSRNGHVPRAYSEEDVDAVVAYSPDTDGVYFIPVARIARRPAIHLRVTPTRNKQRAGVNWAEDFDFAATLERLVGP